MTLAPLTLTGEIRPPRGLGQSPVPLSPADLVETRPFPALLASDYAEQLLRLTQPESRAILKAYHLRNAASVKDPTGVLRDLFNRLNWDEQLELMAMLAAGVTEWHKHQHGEADLGFAPSAVAAMIQIRPITSSITVLGRRVADRDRPQRYTQIKPAELSTTVAFPVAFVQQYAERTLSRSQSEAVQILKLFQYRGATSSKIQPATELRRLFNALSADEQLAVLVFCNSGQVAEQMLLGKGAEPLFRPSRYAWEVLPDLPAPKGVRQTLLCCADPAPQLTALTPMLGHFAANEGPYTYVEGPGGQLRLF